MVCEYNLGHTEFYAFYEFLRTLASEGDMTIDEYERRIIEIEPEEDEEFLRDECLRLGSLRKLGKTMSEVMKNMKSHVTDCGECRTRYKDFVKSQIREELKTALLFKFLGSEYDKEGFVISDFLGLYLE